MKTLKDDKTDKASMKLKSQAYYSAKQEVLEDLKTGFQRLDRTLVEKVNERRPDSADQLFSVMNSLFNDKLKFG